MQYKKEKFHESKLNESEKDSIIDAIKGINKKYLITILPKMHHYDFQSCHTYYSENYTTNLFDDIKNHFSGPLQDLLLSIFTDPIDYDCKELYNAMEGLGTNEDTLIEILGTRSPDNIESIQDRYLELNHRRTLDGDIKDDTSGFFQELLISIIDLKSRQDICSDDQAKELADKLAYDRYDSSKDKDLTFKYVFTKISTNDFKKVLGFYFENKLPMNKLIDKSFCFNSRKLLKTIYYKEVNPCRIYAKKLKKAFGIIKVDYHLLNRIIVTQRNKGKTFIKQIESCYNLMYGDKSLSCEIDRLKNSDELYYELIKGLLFIN